MTQTDDWTIFAPC